MSRALLSVSDKTGLAELAAGLVAQGIDLLSTGGTASFLREHGFQVTDVSEITSFPECLDGRVKTLHPNVHAGILADRRLPEHMAFLEEADIQPIDLVIVNLYPFKETIRKPGVSFADAIENIDIGGPTLLRAAAKNHASVTVITDPADYSLVLTELADQGRTEDATRLYLATKVFSHTAAYDALIASYLTEETKKTDGPQLPKYPNELTLTYEKNDELRYGENSHQTAAFYRQVELHEGSLPAAKQLHGKALSYNNIGDADAALAMLKEFSDEPTVVAVKHANPCGIASADSIDEAWDRAYEADSVSIFGGIVAINRPVTKQMAEKMAKIFLELIIAPAYEDGAFEILSAKKNIRLMELHGAATPYVEGTVAVKSVYDGLLVQDVDLAPFSREQLSLVTNTAASNDDLEDAIFGMKVVKHIKSNAICLVKNKQTVGVGPGQVNRITALEIAVAQAGDKAKGAILASDAFFPFDDSIQAAAKAGVAMIVQPGGSLRDQDSIDACNVHGLPMYFSGKRHFKH